MAQDSESVAFERVRAEKSLQGYRNRERKRTATYSGTLANQAGTIDVPNREGFVFVRLNSDPRNLIHAQVPDGIQKVADLPVSIERVYSEGAPKWVVRGRATAPLYPADPMADTTVSHNTQHLRGDLGTGGFDALDVYNRMLIQCRAQQQATADMTVYVTAGPYIVDGAWHLWAGGNSGTFTAPADHRCDLVYLGADHAIHILRGTDMANPATRPTVPGNAFPLAWVWLDSATTTITEALLEDARLIGNQTLPTTATLTNIVCNLGDVITHNDEVVYAST